jgi:hypothetical protein
MECYLNKSNIDAIIAEGKELKMFRKGMPAESIIFSKEIKIQHDGEGLIMVSYKDES